MNGKFLKFLLIIILLVFAITAVILIRFPFYRNSDKKAETGQGRIIIPQALSDYSDDYNPAEQMARMEFMTLKIPLEEGEILVSLLNEDFSGNLYEDQIVAYRNMLETESPIYLTYIKYNESAREYRRIWNAPTAATRPGTLSLYTQDLIGDRGVCVLLAGMNGQGEHTLTVFRKTPPEEAVNTDSPFIKIAEIIIDGSITVREAERTQAYQMGMVRGQSFTISAFGRDHDSANLLDQVERIYAYSDARGYYEENSVSRIPGTQIEQQRLRELLGNSRAFEDFITGLWYYVSPQGTVDNRQFIYFDPPSKEIIFYEDETQQVFNWQNSGSTRYGLYISSQNISVSTLRRSIDIELESLDSIKVRVIEDVRLNIGVNTSWDGSYRKAGSPVNSSAAAKPQIPFINAVYDSPMGKISFHPDGNFEINSGDSFRQGKYAFYTLDDRQLLEFRSMENRNNEIQINTGSRETYLVEESEDQDPETLDFPKKTLILSSVRLGARGIQELHEGNITLNLAAQELQDEF